MSSSPVSGLWLVFNITFIKKYCLFLIIEKANSLKRLSKACLLLGETVKSADLANCALQIYKGMYGNTMQHREVSYQCSSCYRCPFLC